MIYKPITTVEGFKRLAGIPSNYCGCMWVDGETAAKGVTREDTPLVPPTYPNSPIFITGFATLESDGWQFFLDTAKAEGVTIPITLLSDDMTIDEYIADQLTQGVTVPENLLTDE